MSGSVFPPGVDAHGGHSGRFEEIYRRSLEQPEEFWAQAAAEIDWIEPWQRVLDDSRAPLYRWFAGGRLNTCYNALDRHVERGRAEQLALIYDSPVTGTVATFTYRELRDEVAKFAGALAAQGVGRGDRVVIYMPMVPEAAIAMLGCARIGAIHSVVFGGFAANELAGRIEDARPKVVVSASCGIEPGRLVAYKPLLDAAIELVQAKPERCFILQRPELEAELNPSRDISWTEAVASAEPADCVPVDATDPLYILYTSGTTGQAKGIVRDTGGHAVALKWSMKNVYDVEPGEVYWAASDVGWVVGHSYIVYAPLLHGCTTVLYEGKPVGTPDPGAFWRVISEHGVSAMFTAPTAFRAIRQQDPEAAHIRRYDLSRFRTLFLAGERCDPETLGWAERQLGVPVIDHWWQTETGWAIAANCLGIEPLPVVAGSPTRPVPGWDLKVLDADGRELPAGQTGALVVKLPMPPGATPTLWNADERFRETYLSSFPGYYETADAYWVENARWGARMGAASLVDAVVGCLTDPFNEIHMGVTAENVAGSHGISRDAQDEFAFESHRRARAAIEAGLFAEEVVPIEVKARKGTVEFRVDEHVRLYASRETFSKLRPAFKPDGTGHGRQRVRRQRRGRRGRGHVGSPGGGAGRASTGRHPVLRGVRRGAQDDGQSGPFPPCARRWRGLARRSLTST